MSRSYLTVDESGGDVFSDSMIMTDSGNLVFASLWGRDTGIQQLLGMWTLGDTECGATSLTLKDPETDLQRYSCSVRNVDLTKTSSHAKGTLLGDLVHTFIYDKKCLSGEGNNRRFWLLNSPFEETCNYSDKRIWDTVKRASPVPLLDTWKKDVLSIIRDNQWLTELHGFNMSATLIDLSDIPMVESALSSAVKSGVLQIEGIEPPEMSPSQQESTPLLTSNNLVYAYSRANALDDGVLVDVSEVAKEAGFKLPCAVTRAVWDNLIEWDPVDTKRQVVQDESGRLWDVLYRAALAARPSKESQIYFDLYVVPRDGKSKEAQFTSLKAVCGPGDTLDPVVTIMLPNED